MELKNLINKMNDENISLDQQEIKIKNLIKDSKYNILNSFLEENNIYTTNELKKLSTSDYNKLKMCIPNLDGVGEEKTNLFINMLNNIRKGSNSVNIVNNNKYPLVKNLGKLKTSEYWSIEINNIKYNEYDEYIDIRQVKDDGTRGKGISIKRQYFDEFKNIIGSIQLNEKKDAMENDNSDLDIALQLLTGLDETNQCKSNINNDEIESLDTFFSELESLKEKILRNEDLLYENFKDEYGLSIKFFKSKIQGLKEDGDIVRFLENPSFLNNKQEQYNKIHEKGLKTAIDIKDSYDKTNLKFTTIENLKKGEIINNMTICSIVNNFNHMLDMYFDEENKILVLKCQIKDGPYNDKWIESNKKLCYFLQNEKEENFSKLSFSKYPNTVCKNIILGYDLDTRVYLFYRHNNSENYIFAGEVKLEKFTNGNKSIILSLI